MRGGCWTSGNAAASATVSGCCRREGACPAISGNQAAAAACRAHETPSATANEVSTLGTVAEYTGDRRRRMALRNATQLSCAGNRMFTMHRYGVRARNKGSRQSGRGQANV
jgi:hypothetical protein